MSVARKEVGSISISPKRAIWTIPNFSALLQTEYIEIKSPSFYFKNRLCILYAYPNGSNEIRRQSPLGWFGIAVFILTGIDNLGVELGITNARQENIMSSRGKVVSNLYPFTKLIRRTDFDSLKNQIMPEGTLYVFFNIVRKNEKFASDTVLNASKDRDNDEQTPAYRESSTQTEEASGKTEVKSKLDNASKEKSIQTEEGMGVCGLKEDFEKLLQNENITDVILKMDGQEFRAHRCILAARSPVFLAMMTHDTKEKNTGVVSIEDVDPSAIPDFLHFLYSGNVDNLSSEKALKLYSVADKYQVTELKQNCIDQLMRNISVDNFCDVIDLSLQHCENHLKDACIEFFQKNSLDIVMTSKWQAFLDKNPVTGNELFIKHLQFIKSILQETGKEI